VCRTGECRAQGWHHDFDGPVRRVAANSTEGGFTMATATKTTSPLAELQRLGQSVWMDSISRKILENGELQRRIDEGLQGMTSNPTIFEKAIDHSTDYDVEFRRLVEQKATPEAIYDALTVSDIRRALDLFRPVYDRTEGGDGFVSLEVSPLLAHDTKATLAEAARLWKLLDRPNAMIKIPGTPEGLPAIEESLAAGLNINITLLFSIDAYETVAKAYIRALERRIKAGQPVDRIASVASFFVSRIDTEVDKRIEAKLKSETDAARKKALEGLLGKAAIANAKNAYAIYQRLFEGPEFAPLKAKGAKAQRVLWASVSTKNPKYPDTLYVSELIGPNTVSTMPPETIEAFKDHGHARLSLTEDMAGARQTIARLGELGIDFKDVTDVLLTQGVESFRKSFEDLMSTIGQKREKLMSEKA
jgi:transaldolase